MSSKMILLMLIIKYQIRQVFNFIINIIENMLWNLLKNIDADDEKSIIKDGDLSIDIVPETSDKEDKSLKDELICNTLKTVNNVITGQGLNFDKIKIDENLLKRNILKVRYINSNRKINNKFLKEDYKISNNMKNSILKILV